MTKKKRKLTLIEQPNVRLRLALTKRMLRLETTSKILERPSRRNCLRELITVVLSTRDNWLKPSKAGLVTETPSSSVKTRRMLWSAYLVKIRLT